jgi:hypothetical protein
VLLTRQTYEGYVIEAVSYNGALGRPRPNKWGEWYPAYRVYREGVRGKPLHQETLEHPVDSQDEANRSAIKAAKSWIDNQNKKA